MKTTISRQPLIPRGQSSWRARSLGLSGASASGPGFQRPTMHQEENPGHQRRSGENGGRDRADGQREPRPVAPHDRGRRDRIGRPNQQTHDHEKKPPGRFPAPESRTAGAPPPRARLHVWARPRLSPMPRRKRSRIRPTTTPKRGRRTPSRVSRLSSSGQYDAPASSVRPLASCDKRPSISNGCLSHIAIGAVSGLWRDPSGPRGTPPSRRRMRRHGPPCAYSNRLTSGIAASNDGMQCVGGEALARLHSKKVTAAGAMSLSTETSPLKSVFSSTCLPLRHRTQVSTLRLGTK